MGGRLTEAEAEQAGFFKSVIIPPRPALFLALQRELRKEDKDIRRVAELVNRDVAMAAKLLEATNSAFFGLRRHVNTVPEAIQLIGTDYCAAVMSGLILKNALGVGIMMLARFWDVSEKRARGMNFLAREMRIVDPQLAYSFGLFCDIGIPLMKSAFPPYLETLAIANRHGALNFIAVETERHGVDHASIGAMLAARWALDDEVASAIAMHHDYDKLYDESIPDITRALIALNSVVERAIQEFRGDQLHEWDEGGHVTSAALELSEDEVEQLCEGVKEKFHG